MRCNHPKYKKKKKREKLLSQSQKHCIQYRFWCITYRIYNFYKITLYSFYNYLICPYFIQSNQMINFALSLLTVYHWSWTSSHHYKANNHPPRSRWPPYFMMSVTTSVYQADTIFHFISSTNKALHTNLSQRFPQFCLFYCCIIDMLILDTFVLIIKFTNWLVWIFQCNL